MAVTRWGAAHRWVIGRSFSHPRSDVFYWFHGSVWILFQDPRPVRTNPALPITFMCVRSLCVDQDSADNSYLCVRVTVINCLQIPSEFNFPELLNSLQMWNFIYLVLKDWQVGLRMRKCKSSDFNQRLVRSCQRTYLCWYIGHVCSYSFGLGLFCSV